jgi:hypothetical protein
MMGVVRRKQRQSDSTRTIRPPGNESALSEATLRQLSDHGISETPVPARVLETPSGQRWLVVLIARLASIDASGDARGGRLILRAEPLFGEQERARIVTVKAMSLDEMDGTVLRDALLRRRTGETPRLRRRG